MTEVLDLISEMANRVLADHCAPENWNTIETEGPRGPLWTTLEDQGLFLAGVAEEDGGGGLGFSGLMALVEMSAYHGAPTTIADTLLARSLCSQLGQAVPDGPITVCIDPAQFELRLAADGTLNGAWQHVPLTCLSNPILALAEQETGGTAIVLFDPALGSRSDADCLTVGGEPCAALSITDNAPIWAAAMQVSSTREKTVGLVAVLRSAQMIGAMRRALELSASYVQDRKQFGRPLAKFQAVQHMLAEAAQHYSAAMVMTQSAAESHDSDDFPLLAALAKSRASDAVEPIVDAAHQVHGAMGFTREYPLQHLTRRLWTWRDTCGTETYWNEIIGRTALANEPSNLWGRVTSL